MTANVPAVDPLAAPAMILLLGQLVQPVGRPEEPGSQGSVLRRRHQLRLHDEVNPQRLTSVVIVGRASQLDAATATEAVAVARRLIAVAHAIGVDHIGDLLGVASVLVSHFQTRETLGPQAHQRCSLVVQVLFQQAEVAALMAALTDEHGLLFGRRNAKALEGFIQRADPLVANVKFGELFIGYH
jgi:hypothetical protein